MGGCNKDMGAPDQGYIDAKADQIREEHGTGSKDKFRPAPFQRDRVSVRAPGAKFYVASELETGFIVRPWDREDFWTVVRAEAVAGTYQQSFRVVLQHGDDEHDEIEDRLFSPLARFELHSASRSN